MYFEDSSSGPYNVRRIEELSKNASGNVEARVAVFYRRRDVSNALLKIADQAERRNEEFVVEKSQSASSGNSGPVANGSKDDVKAEADTSDEKKESDDDGKFDWGFGGLPAGAEKLTADQRYRLRQRELFLSRQIETLPATQIRGKCSVTLLSEIETPECYDREDTFFYSLVYDSVQMTLLADKGAIRVGEKYQATVPVANFPTDEKQTKVVADIDDNKENGDLMIDEDNDSAAASPVAVNGTSSSGSTKDDGPISETERETIVYHPYHNLSEREIDQFLIVARSVGTFSRALDTSSSTKLPSLHMTAAAASRDVTILHAMALLHQANYDLGQGLKYLVPPPSKQHYPLDVDKSVGHNTVSLGGPILIRDQIEEWSASEANLFEEALEKYGKDFSDIRNDFLPWKAMRDIVEYYYMWKTTNRYIDARKKKASEDKDSKLKQVYIPNHNKPCANLIGQMNTTGVVIPAATPCEGCKKNESTNWYGWGPAQMQLRLCHNCWGSWKRNGGLADKHEFDRYDLEGGVDMSAMESKCQTTSNPMAINRTSAAAQNRVVGAGQIIARLPPSHPQFSAAAAAVSASGAKTGPRAPFNMRVNFFTRVARRLTPKSVMNMRKQARRPGPDISWEMIKAHVSSVDLIRLVDAAKAISKNDKIPQAFQQYLLPLVAQHQQNMKRSASGLGGGAGEPSSKRMAP